MFKELKAYSIVDRLKEIKLLPCPNCGEAHNIGQNSDREWHIYCFPAGEDEFHAADAWNSLPRRSDIERMERERDWLAVNLANGLVDPGCIEHLAELGGMSPPDPATLIEAAKEATCQKN